MYRDKVFKKEIGSIIKRKRVEKGLKQDELAELLSTDRMTISKWENGISKPQKAKLDKLCEVLEINYERMVFIATERTAQNEVNNIQNYYVDETIRIPLYSRMPGNKLFSDAGLKCFINISSRLLNKDKKYYAIECLRKTINFAYGDVLIFESTNVHDDDSICCCVINGEICVIYGYIVDLSGVECIGVLRRAIKEY